MTYADLRAIPSCSSTVDARLLSWKGDSKSISKNSGLEEDGKCKTWIRVNEDFTPTYGEGKKKEQ